MMALGSHAIYSDGTVSTSLHHSLNNAGDLSHASVIEFPFHMLEAAELDMVAAAPLDDGVRFDQNVLCPVSSLSNITTYPAVSPQGVHVVLSGADVPRTRLGEADNGSPRLPIRWFSMPLYPDTLFSHHL